MKLKKKKKNKEPIFHVQIYSIFQKTAVRNSHCHDFCLFDFTHAANVLHVYYLMLFLLSSCLFSYCGVSISFSWCGNWDTNHLHGLIQITWPQGTKEEFYQICFLFKNVPHLLTVLRMNSELLSRKAWLLSTCLNLFQAVVPLAHYAARMPAVLQRSIQSSFMYLVQPMVWGHRGIPSAACTRRYISR